MLTRLPAARASGVRNAELELVTITTAALLLAGTVIAAVGTVTAFTAPWPSLLGAHDLPAHDVRLAVVCFFVLGGLAVPANIGTRMLSAMQQAYVVYSGTRSPVC